MEAPSVLRGPLRRRLQQFLQLLLVEAGGSGGEMAAGLAARRNEIESSVFDLFQRAVHQSGFRWITFVVRGVDCEHRRLDPCQTRLGIVVVRRFPLVDDDVGVYGNWR